MRSTVWRRAENKGLWNSWAVACTAWKLTEWHSSFRVIKYLSTCKQSVKSRWSDWQDWSVMKLLSCFNHGMKRNRSHNRDWWIEQSQVRRSRRPQKHNYWKCCTSTARICCKYVGRIWRFCRALKWRPVTTGLCCSVGEVVISRIDEPIEFLKELFSDEI